MEAAMNGARAIALSQFYARWAEAPEDMFEPARRFGAEAVRRVLAMPERRFLFYNVNFPALRADLVRGFRACPHGLRTEATFEIVPVTAPNGRDYQFYRHNTANASAPEGSDARLLIEGWITVTPLMPSLTAEEVLAEAEAALAGAIGRG
jgi:5'-nucleotidase